MSDHHLNQLMILQINKDLSANFFLILLMTAVLFMTLFYSVELRDVVSWDQRTEIEKIFLKLLASSPKSLTIEVLVQPPYLSIVLKIVNYISTYILSDIVVNICHNRKYILVRFSKSYHLPTILCVVLKSLHIFLAVFLQSLTIFIINV